jgi:hypothetical protein
MQNVPITEIDEEAVRRIASEANGASS